MTRLGRLFQVALFSAAIVPFSNVIAQGDTTTVVCGDAGVISTYCYVASDSQTWNYEASGAGTMRLRFNQGTIESATFDHLTIYDGSNATGTVLYDHVGAAVNLGPVGSGANTSTLIFDAVEVYASGSSLFMVMSSDGSVQCSGSTTYDEWEWEVVCLDCTLPVATYTIMDDCANGQFSIPINVTSTGDGAVVNIVYIVNGGDPQTVINVGLGLAELGPFALNDTVNVVVEHENNFLCNFDFGDLTDTGMCPVLIDCGTELVESVCYGNNVDLRYYYRGTGAFPLGIFFDQGAITVGDSLIIYDGGDITAPVLYASTATIDATGLFRSTTNPEHRLTVRIRSNGFTSCATNLTQVPTIWRVACLDCVPPTVEFNIVQDCANFQYTIDVVISDLGSDLEVGIITTATQDTVYVTQTGTTSIGPFVSGTELEVTTINDANALCNVYSGMLVNPLCPVPIECPGATLMETYCYGANDEQAWAYELQGTGGTLRLTFVRGTIESNTWDDLIIYDGPDNTSPILFEHANATANLGPVGSAILSNSTNYETIDVAASGQNLYMEMSSDASVQCQTSTTTYDPWEWSVYCVNCTNPQASINLVPDCIHRQYSAEVIVTEVGGDANLSVANILSGDTLTDLGVGVHTFGPFPVDSPSVFQVFNQDYVQCRYTSDSLTFASDSCIIVSCGVDNYEYCYENSEDRWYTYQSAQNVPTTVRFLQGQLLTGDIIAVYNGRNSSSPILYQGNNGGNLAGFAVNSANTGNAITLRIKSDAAGSCDDGQATIPLQWAVGCGAVGLSELTTDGFMVFPNPTDGLLQIQLGSKVTGKVQLRVTDMSGRLVMEEQLVMNDGTRNTVEMADLQSGQYLVQLTTANWVKTERVQIAH